MAPTSSEVNSQLVTGVIAIASGVATLIATLVTTHLLRSGGKITIKVNSSSFEKLTADSSGGEKVVDLWTDAERVEYRFDLDFFNSSDIPKNLRAVSIEIKSEIKKPINLKAYIPRKIEPSVGMTYGFPNPFEELRVINLPSREIINFKLSGSIKKEEIQSSQGKIDFFYKGEFPNGRIFREKLISIKFSR